MKDRAKTPGKLRKKTPKRKAATLALGDSSWGLAIETPETTRSQGSWHDLTAIFNQLNRTRFKETPLLNYRIVWGKRRAKKPRREVVFAYIQEADREICVNPRLDQPWVPRWFVQFLVYHEMLHACVPVGEDSSGRRIVHTKEFNALEAKHPYYQRHKRWLKTNLWRFLRVERNG